MRLALDAQPGAVRVALHAERFDRDGLLPPTISVMSETGPWNKVGGLTCALLLAAALTACNSKPNIDKDNDAGVIPLGCGNGELAVGEACDDGNNTAADGCDPTCALEAGWNCSTGICQASLCGDGIVAGAEECEDNDTTPTSGDGCSSSCKLEEGFKCPSPGQACTTTLCGDNVAEGTEQCDDGNKNTGDGCNPFCKREPSCSNGTCTPVCGDGVILPNDTTEECDDGDLKNGDGCSNQCKKEPNFTCTLITEAPPDFIDIPVVYRDFLGWDLTGQAARHEDFENVNQSETGLLGCAASVGVTESSCSPLSQLDTEGKPVLTKASPVTVSSATTFGQWYRSNDSVNRTVVDKLSLERQPNGSYIFEDTTFFPLDTRGWVQAGNESLRSGNGDGLNHNFHFTSEARYWFEYKGTEVLDFYGDDDVFVFINKRLAVDIGGVHGPVSGRITLANKAAALGLTVGGIYEAAVFQAERHVTGSQYKLTLTNFESRRTECVPNFLCGDGVAQAPNEQCDDGTNDGGYGQCAPGCLLGPRCGDDVIQGANGEQCDDGNATSGDGCSSTCQAEVN
jgi:fibro-slime domain-containing protein